MEAGEFARYGPVIIDYDNDDGEDGVKTIIRSSVVADRRVSEREKSVPFPPVHVVAFL